MDMILIRKSDDMKVLACSCDLETIYITCEDKILHTRHIIKRKFVPRDQRVERRA